MNSVDQEILTAERAILATLSLLDITTSFEISMDAPSGIRDHRSTSFHHKAQSDLSNLFSKIDA